MFFGPSPADALGKAQFGQFFAINQEIQIKMRMAYAETNEIFFYEEELNKESRAWIYMNAVGSPVVNEQGDLLWTLKKKTNGQYIVIKFLSRFDSQGLLSGWQCTSPNWPEVEKLSSQCRF